MTAFLGVFTSVRAVQPARSHPLKKRPMAEPRARTKEEVFNGLFWLVQLPFSSDFSGFEHGTINKTSIATNHQKTMRIAPKIACVFHDLAKREMKLGAVILGVGNLLCGWFKNQLREMIKRLLAMLEVMGMFIHMPDVQDVLLLE